MSIKWLIDSVKCKQVISDMENSLMLIKMPNKIHVISNLTLNYPNSPCFVQGHFILKCAF